MKVEIARERVRGKILEGCRSRCRGKILEGWLVLTTGAAGGSSPSCALLILYKGNAGQCIPSWQWDFGSPHTAYSTKTGCIPLVFLGHLLPPGDVRTTRTQPQRRGGMRHTCLRWRGRGEAAPPISHLPWVQGGGQTLRRFPTRLTQTGRILSLNFGPPPHTAAIQPVTRMEGHPQGPPLLL